MVFHASRSFLLNLSCSSPDRRSDWFYPGFWPGSAAQCCSPHGVLKLAPPTIWRTHGLIDSSGSGAPFPCLVPRFTLLGDRNPRHCPSQQVSALFKKNHTNKGMKFKRTDFLTTCCSGYAAKSGVLNSLSACGLRCTVGFTHISAVPLRLGADKQAMTIIYQHRKSLIEQALNTGGGQ